MPWFILGVSFLVAALLGGRWFVNANPKKIVRTLRYLGIAVLVLLVIGLIVSRQAALLVPAALVALSLLGRRIRMPFPGGFGGAGHRPRPGQATEVETDWLEMRLDHDSGEISGQVRKGPFAGRQLAQLGFDELVRLLADLQREDEQGAAILMAYLDRTQGEDWRERAAQMGAGAAGRASGGTSDMTVDEACEILGLKPGATVEEIREAHHRLMKQVHPDHGGSEYLARKINQAKDLLLKG